MEQPYTQTLVSCPICGGRLTPFLTARDNTVSHELFNLQTCQGCGFCVTNPRPDPAHIGAFYESDEYISHSNTSQGFQQSIYRAVRSLTLRNKHKLVRHFCPTGKILDVGCGTGEFLGYLKGRGYQVYGIEPSSKARRVAIENNTLSVVPDLDQLPTHEQFQVITLWHVLEHVHDVRDTLKKLHSRAAQGAILIIAVPDRESWDAEHYGSNWAAYDVPRHLSHFRRKDMTRLLSEQGFQVLQTRCMWFDAPYVSMLSEKYKGAGSGSAFIKGALWGMASNAIAATSNRPTSSSLYIARKA